MESPEVSQAAEKLADSTENVIKGYPGCSPDEYVVVNTTFSEKNKTIGTFVYVVHKTYPPSREINRALAGNIFTNAKLTGCHPNQLVTYRVTPFKNYSILTETEFVNGGDLEHYIAQIKLAKKQEVPTTDQKFSEFRAHQVQFAKSVARQLIEYVFWLQTVICTCHGNIDPRTILLRRDGCIKLKFFGLLTEGKVRANPDHYLTSCLYTAPEAEISPSERIDAGPLNDIWAIGAVVYSIMKGECYLPKEPAVDPPAAEPTTKKRRLYSTTSELTITEAFVDNNDIPFYVQRVDRQLEGFGTSFAPTVNNSIPVLNLEDEYAAFMKFVDTPFDEKWVELFGDRGLAYLARLCLTKEVCSRPDAIELLAYMHLVGVKQSIASDNKLAAKTIEADVAKHEVPNDAWKTVLNKNEGGPFALPSEFEQRGENLDTALFVPNDPVLFQSRAYNEVFDALAEECRRRYDSHKLSWSQHGVGDKSGSKAVEDRLSCAKMALQRAMKYTFIKMTELDGAAR